MYLVDFGFAKRFRKKSTMQHLEKKTEGLIIGSPAYQSLNSHLGNTLSRQDDLESLSYVLVDMIYPDLLQKIVIKKNIELQAAKKKLTSYMKASNKFYEEIIEFVMYA